MHLIFLSPLPRRRPLARCCRSLLAPVHPKMANLSRAGKAPGSLGLSGTAGLQLKAPAKKYGLQKARPTASAFGRLEDDGNGEHITRVEARLLVDALVEALVRRRVCDDLRFGALRDCAGEAAV